MSKLVIKQFGPIDNLELDISKQFSVVIGEQATGKSTIAKAIAFFNNVSQMVHFGIVQCFEENKGQTKENVMNTIKINMQVYLRGIFGAYSFRDRSVLEYTYKDGITLKVLFAENSAEFIFSKDFINLIFFKLDSMITMFSKNKVEFNDILINSFMIARKIEEEISEFSFMFLPADRTMAIITKDIPQTVSKGLLKSEVMQNFFERIVDYRRDQERGISLTWKELCKDNLHLNDAISTLDKLAADILHGSYVYHKSGDTLKINNTTNEIPLYYASSGQQEVVWIINLLKDAMFNRKQTFFIVEEPESHLYPTSQVALVKFIVFVTKELNGGCMVTTHSPYVLSSFNLLAHVGRLQSKNIQCTQFEIEDKCSIPFGSLDAYKLERKEYGSILRNIVDKNGGLIDTLEIDEASDYLNSMTDAFYELEFPNEM